MAISGHLEQIKGETDSTRKKRKSGYELAVEETNKERGRNGKWA